MIASSGIASFMISMACCVQAIAQSTTANPDLLLAPPDAAKTFSVTDLLANDLSSPANGTNIHLSVSGVDSLSAQGANIKFVASESWSKLLDGNTLGLGNAAKVAVDGEGNVYVTGGADYDYSTAKYKGNGERVWIAKYNGPENGPDDAYGLAVDSAGNAYVTGTSWTGSNSVIATVKYDANGNQLWVTRFIRGSAGGFALTIDNSGNCYVTGFSSDGTTGIDMTTVKYDANGNELWARFYDGEQGIDQARSISVDTNGNVFVTGNSWRADSNGDYATIKYDTNGNELWVARYTSAEDSSDEPSQLAVDNLGNCYVTGRSRNPVSGSDYTTIKYDPSGNPLWTKNYDGPSSSDDNAHALALDSNGDVFVTGFSRGTGGTIECATVKYDTDGNQLWARRFNELDSDFEYGNCVATDVAGNAYVAAASFGPKGGLLTLKYSPDGNLCWVGHSLGEVPYAVALDAENNIIVAGMQFAVAKYSQTTTLAYTPPKDFLGTDTFNYTIRDGLGSNSVGTVTVRVGCIVLPPFITESGVTVRFRAKTNANYTIERAESLSGPWSSIGTANVADDGVGALIDAIGTGSAVFYRVLGPN